MTTIRQWQKWNVLSGIIL